MKDYYNEMIRGKEVTIVSNDPEYLSGVFWINDGIIYSFNTELGVLKRPELGRKSFNNHIKRMKEEDAFIFVRGYYDD